MDLREVQRSFLMMFAIVSLAVCQLDDSGVDYPSLKAFNETSIPRSNDSVVELIIMQPPNQIQNSFDRNQNDSRLYLSPIIHQNSETRKKRTPTWGGGWGGGWGWGGGGGRSWGGGGCGTGECGTPTKVIVIPVTIHKEQNNCDNGCGQPPPPPPPKNNCGGGCCTGHCGFGSKSASYSSSFASASASSFSSSYGWGKK